MVKRISERDLIEPVLKLIQEHDDGDGLNISEIKNLLRGRLNLSKGDMEILSGRSDDRFSQVVRNLISHKTLQKSGFVEYRKVRGQRGGKLFLTARGRVHLNESRDWGQPDLFGGKYKD